MSKQRAFEEQVATRLRASEEQLGVDSCLRLQAMRQQAVKSAESARRANKPNQWWASGQWVSLWQRWESVLAVAGVMAIAVLLSLPEQSPGVMNPAYNMAIEEGAHEDPEFYEALEFYQWLAEQELAG